MKRAHTDTDKAKRKEKILKASLHEFANAGVDATRMEDIANSAGVSKGTLYLYFKSKDALFTALINDYASAKVKQAINSIQVEKDIRKTLRELMNTISQIMVEDELAKLIPLLIANAHRAPDIVSDYEKNIINVGQPLITNLLQEGIDAGIFRPHNSAQYARLVFAPALQSVIFQTLFVKDKPLQYSELNALLNLQLDMLFAYLETSHD